MHHPEVRLLRERQQGQVAPSNLPGRPLVLRLTAAAGHKDESLTRTLQELFQGHYGDFSGHYGSLLKKIGKGHYKDLKSTL